MDNSAKRLGIAMLTVVVVLGLRTPVRLSDRPLPGGDPRRDRCAGARVERGGVRAIPPKAAIRPEPGGGCRNSF